MNNETIGGAITLSEEVVATVAAMAAKNIEGVHGLGRTNFRDLFRGGGERSSRGVEVEVGQKEVAIDIDLIVNYGYNIQEIAGQVRQAIHNDIERHTGLKTVEINITVSDIHFDQEPEAKPKKRVE